MWLMQSVPISLQAEATDAMDSEKEEPQAWPVWIDWDRKIVSFQEEKGFDRLDYPTHDEMFRFAIEKTMEGFAIQ